MALFWHGRSSTIILRVAFSHKCPIDFMVSRLATLAGSPSSSSRCIFNCVGFTVRYESVIRQRLHVRKESRECEGPKVAWDSHGV